MPARDENMSAPDTVFENISEASLEKSQLAWAQQWRNPLSDASPVPYYVSGEKVKRHFIGYAGRPATIKMPEVKAA
jgi:hypothetical protein